MGLKELLDKYNNGEKFNKDGWFTLKEPTLEDAKRIAAKGRLEDLGFRIPLELRRYLDISAEGELVEKQEIPEELKGLAVETRKAFERVKNNVK